MSKKGKEGSVMGYQMTSRGFEPGPITITTATTSEELAGMLRAQGTPEEAIELAMQGKPFLVSNTPTIFGVHSEVISVADTQFHPRIAYGSVHKHPLRDVEREVFLADFGVKKDGGTNQDRLLRDQMTVSDARINTKNWTIEQLEKLDKKFQAAYPGNVLFPVLI